LRVGRLRTAGRVVPGRVGSLRGRRFDYTLAARIAYTLDKFRDGDAVARWCVASTESAEAIQASTL
jgi:hypothetical protein